MRLSTPFLFFPFPFDFVFFVYVDSAIPFLSFVGTFVVFVGFFVVVGILFVDRLLLFLFVVGSVIAIFFFFFGALASFAPPPLFFCLPQLGSKVVDFVGKDFVSFRNLILDNFVHSVFNQRIVIKGPWQDLL
jgi:hypothetical protein